LRLALTIALLAGAAVRLLRLDWQPIWWDEGYSVYFATEPLARMAWLTAQDIHPPLYYALLHGWITLLHNSTPAALRILAVLCAAPAILLIGVLAADLFPARPRIVLLAMLLLALNPLHLFYSQELRMYGLALTLGLAASIAYWRFISAIHQDRWWLPALAYWLLATLSLYTLYYCAFLLLAHWVWAVWRLRRAPWDWLRAALPGAAAAIVFLPWLFYTAPKLLPYVADKVRSDQDSALDPLTYLWRHVIAFTSGQIQPDGGWYLAIPILGVAGLVLLVLACLVWRRQATPLHSSHGALGFLWSAFGLPVGIAYLINLRYPFFPEGGERLLLFVLPYALLLVAAGIERSAFGDFHAGALAGKIAASALLIAALSGVLSYFTVPRYSADDYRPLIRQVIQQGSETDTVLALFPWQVGFWRAYSPRSVEGELIGPQPAPVDQQALEWNGHIVERIEHALSGGVLWLPAPVAIGSHLPAQIESYLVENAINLDNDWFSPSTRLSAWVRLPEPPVAGLLADMGSLQLRGAGIAPAEAAAANQPLAVALAWRILDDTHVWHLTLRLLDGEGRVWARRDHEPLGQYRSHNHTANGAAGDAEFTETVAFLIPAGLPPGQYTLHAGVGAVGDDELLPADTGDGDFASLLAIGGITVTLPTTPAAAARLPVVEWLDPPQESGGLSILGASGDHRSGEFLSGTLLPLTLYLQNQNGILPARNAYASLLDSGEGVAGWEGWSLPTFTAADLPPGHLLQLPASFYIPATLPSGVYRLIAGFSDPASGERFPAAQLGNVQIFRRAASFEPPSPPHALAKDVQVGTHARLLGYALTQNANTVEVVLYWQALQSLLPPHHIFIHAADEGGVRIAQDDGPPVAAEGPAPTGSWLPGEYVATYHSLALPNAGTERKAGAVTLTTGLYDPVSGQRLPIFIAGSPSGDSILLTTLP
jgi:hypothetical protein